MSFALEEVKLWRYVERTAIASSPFMTKKNDSKVEIERIYACEEKICPFQDNVCKTIAKIGKMCTESV